MADITKDDVYTILDHMLSSEYPAQAETDGADLDEVADHIYNYVSANIDDFLEMYNEPEDGY